MNRSSVRITMSGSCLKRRPPVSSAADVSFARAHQGSSPASRTTKAPLAIGGIVIPSLRWGDNSQRSGASVLDRDEIGDIDARRPGRQRDPAVQLAMAAKLGDGDHFLALPGGRRETDRDSAALEDMQLGDTCGTAGRRKRDRDFAG